MENKIWNKLSEVEQEKVASKNECNSIQIYDESGKEANPIPEHAHCIVYCHGSNTHGWAEINKPDELGLDALIAESWILVSDLKS